ncbi:MAG: tetratricopeptide repeat protein [Deltaproteobacteria bacterium]|nr:tetratricopeptide repeat protein [Deltaproteobacteria bacterium]
MTRNWRWWAHLVVGVFFLLKPVPALGEDLLAQGLAAFQAKNYAKAIDLLGQHLKKYPHTVEGWRTRAACLEALGRQAEALADLDRGLSYTPRETPLLFDKGRMLAALERRPEAIDTFSAILKLEPSNTEALKERGETLAQEGRLDEALNDLSRAVALAPTDAWAYYKLGMVHLCLAQNKEAAAAFSTAIRLKPETPLFYFARGQVYLRHLNQKEKAVADFQQGCRLGHPLCCQELEKMDLKPPKGS